jgi:hypothetical protein
MELTQFMGRVADSGAGASQNCRGRKLRQGNLRSLCKTAHNRPCGLAVALMRDCCRVHSCVTKSLVHAGSIRREKSETGEKVRNVTSPSTPFSPPPLSTAPSYPVRAKTNDVTHERIKQRRAENRPAESPFPQPATRIHPNRHNTMYQLIHDSRDQQREWNPNWRKIAISLIDPGPGQPILNECNSPGFNSYSRLRVARETCFYLPAIRTAMLSGQKRPSRFNEVGNEVRALVCVAYFLVDVSSGYGAERL